MSDNNFPLKDLATREGQGLISEAILQFGSLVSSEENIIRAEEAAVNSASCAYESKKDRERSEIALKTVLARYSYILNISSSLISMYEDAISGGNISQYPLDTSLSISGEAADSKVTGDTISYLSHRIDDLGTNHINRINVNSFDRRVGFYHTTYYIEDSNYVTSEWIYIGDLPLFYTSYVQIVSWGDKNRQIISSNYIDNWNIAVARVNVPNDAVYVKVSYPLGSEEYVKLCDSLIDDMDSRIGYNKFYMKNLSFTDEQISEIRNRMINS